MCRRYKLACLNHCVSCYLTSIVDLILVRWWKNVHRVSTKQHGAEVKYLSSQKLDHLANSVYWCTGLLEHVKVKLFPLHVNAITLRIFCGCNSKTSRICHQQTRLSSPSEQGSKWHTSWDKQACTYDTL